MIVITREQKEIIEAHALKEYPYECCGVLIGEISGDKRKLLKIIRPVDNTRDIAEKRRRFTISPDELLKNELFAERNNLEVLGFYHSHPDHPAEPSAYDLEHAWPFYSYIIISVRNGKTENFLSWQLADTHEKFNAEAIIEGE